MQIWPAIDIRDGKCVRLTQGDYEREKVYGSDPADMATRFALDGASGLHLVDLDGARSGQSDNLASIQKIAQQVEIPIQVGGGIRTESTIETLISFGVRRLIVGTKAIEDRSWLIEMSEKFPGQLLVSIDARNGKVATDGWEKTSTVLATDLVQQLSALPLAGIVFTDIARDGMLAGPNFDEIMLVSKVSSIPVIASGGVTTVADVERLAAIPVEGAIVGKSLYEGRLSITDAVSAAKSVSMNR